MIEVISALMLVCIQTGGWTNTQRECKQKALECVEKKSKEKVPLNYFEITKSCAKEALK